MKKLRKFKPNKTWAKRFLPAVKKLRREYAKGNYGNRCPLCEIRSKHYKWTFDIGSMSDLKVCVSCPWTVLNGYPCTREPDPRSWGTLASFDTEYKKRALIRLDKWERKLLKWIK